ncbi:hypothetical protein GCM10009748_23200 [Agromyces lapidis]
MSTRAVQVKDLAPYISRHVSFTFCDGWEYWPMSGILLGIDKPEGFHLTYLTYCDCGDDPCELIADEHGAVAMSDDDLVRVNVGGRS